MAKIAKTTRTGLAQTAADAATHEAILSPTWDMLNTFTEEVRQAKVNGFLDEFGDWDDPANEGVLKQKLIDLANKVEPTQLDYLYMLGFLGALYNLEQGE